MCPIRRRLIFLSLLIVGLPALSFAPIPVIPDPFIIHWKHTERLFKKYQPEATQYETFIFAKTSFYGAWGHPVAVPLTSCLSCREGGFKTKTPMGRMGGHKQTILAGSKIIDGPITDKEQRWRWLKKHPDHMIACLSAQFTKLLRLYGEEKAVRMWVKGMSWKCDDAGSYWRDVQVMRNYYEGTKSQ